MNSECKICRVGLLICFFSIHCINRLHRSFHYLPSSLHPSLRVPVGHFSFSSHSRCWFVLLMIRFMSLLLGSPLIWVRLLRFSHHNKIYLVRVEWTLSPYFANRFLFLYLPVTWTFLVIFFSFLLLLLLFLTSQTHYRDSEKELLCLSCGALVSLHATIWLIWFHWHRVEFERHSWLLLCAPHTQWFPHC